mgnify:CR=1 FL=1
MTRTFAANEALKRIVDDKCVSHAKLAKAVGMRTDTLSKIINKKRPIFADEIPPFCRALGIGISELFDQIENDKSA